MPLEQTLDRLYGTPRRARRSQQSAQPTFDLTPEQTTSLLGRVGSGTVGAIGGAANLLDLPGSSVRDLIGLAGGGSFERYNPFDQWLDPFGKEASTNRATGRDLLRGGGLIGKKDTWGNFAAGLGVDIFTDPLTYATLGAGAAGPTGRAAKAAGVFGDISEVATKKLGRRVGPREALPLLGLEDLLTTGVKSRYRRGITGAHSRVQVMQGARDIAEKTGRQVDDVLQDKLGGLGRAFVPVTDIEKIIGTGPRAQSAARLMDTIGHGIRSSAPIRHAAGLFGNTGGAVTEVAQKNFAKVDDKVQAANQGPRQSLAELIGDEGFRQHLDFDTIRKGVSESGVLKGDDLTRSTNEIINARSNEMLDYLEGIKKTVDPNLVPEDMLKQLDKMKQLVKNQYENETFMGAKTRQLGDQFANYWPRVRNYLGRGGLKSKPQHDVNHRFQDPRLDFMTNIRGGTSVLQRMSVDPNISGYAWRYGAKGGKKGMERFEDFLTDTAAENLHAPSLQKAELDTLVDYVKREYGNDLRMDHPTNQGEFIGLQDTQLRDLARWSAGLDIKHSQLNIPAFEVNPVAALTARMEFGQRAAATYDAASDIIAESVVPTASLDPGRGRSAKELLDRMYDNDVPQQAKDRLLEKMQGTPAGALLKAAREESAVATSKTTREAQVAAEIARGDLLEKVEPKFQEMASSAESTLKDLERKQATLKRFNAAEAIEPTVDDLRGGMGKVPNTSKIDELGDSLPNAADMQKQFDAWDDILAAAEEVAPAAISKDVMDELKGKISGLRTSLDEYKRRVGTIKAMKTAGYDTTEKVKELEKWWNGELIGVDDATFKAGGKGGVAHKELARADLVEPLDQAESSSLMDVLFGGAPVTPEAQQVLARLHKMDRSNAPIGDWVEAAKVEEDIARVTAYRDKALANAESSGRDPQAITDAYQRLIDNIDPVAASRRSNASPSIQDTLKKAINRVKSQVRRELKGSTIETARKTLSDLAEKTAAQASSVNARAALRASKTFGIDAAEDAAEEVLERLRSTVDGTAINANSLEDLDIGAIRQAFNESLGTVRDGIRKTFDDGVGVSAENAGKKAAASSDDDVLSKLFIPEQVADDLVRYTGAMSKSPALAGFENAIDRFLGHWKAAMTIDWPAFHSRNYVSGQVYNFLSGAWSIASHAASWKLVLGKNANGLQKIKEFSTLTDAQASRKLREELFVNDVANHDHGMHFIPELASKQKGLLGQSPVFRGPGVDTTRLERANPLNLEAFAPHRIGQDAARFTEGLNRVTPYIELRKKGWTPQAAAKRVNEIQVNYKSSAVADKLMGRLFPFWKFSKGMVPFTLKELGQKPGGGIAQTMRAANRARGTDELTPDYVADTTSIPLGKLPDGSNRYITGLGLPFEDVFSLVNANDPQSSGREVLSRMNPLIKGPAELFTGQSFFQKGPIGGRPIEDLDPTIGRTLSNIGQLAKDPKRILFGGEHESVDPVPTSRLAEFVLSNSPLSRATTTARVASDPRKGLGAKAANLLTGFKVADVSPASQDALLREEAAKAMKRLGGKSFTRTYIPKERREKMSPEAQLDALLLDSLMSELARRAKERKAARTR